MSLVNVAFHAKRALVCVDTEGGHNCTDLRAEYSKMVALPHLNIVFAVRGVTGTLTFVYATACHTWPSSFQAIADRVPTAMREAIEHARANMPGAQIGKQEIAMVGYCSEAERMRALHFGLEPSGEAERQELQEEGSFLSPWAPEWGEPCQPQTAEAMHMTALEQIRKARVLYPTAPLGGRLLLAEVTKDAVNMRQLATVPAFEPAIAEAPRMSKFMRGLIGR